MGGKALTRAQRSLSGERVFNALLAVDREPFRALLEEMIGGRPSVAAIAEWAEKNPDRWAQAVGIFARLTGYDFKGTMTHEHTHKHLHLHTMSDSELETEIARMREPGAALSAEGALVGVLGDGDGDEADGTPHGMVEEEIVEVDEPLGLGEGLW